MVQRRERTRHLIELGGCACQPCPRHGRMLAVQKAGLVELTDDDRAVLLGAFLAVAAQLQDDNRIEALTLWRRRGKRAFEEEVISRLRSSTATRA